MPTLPLLSRRRHESELKAAEDQAVKAVAVALTTAVAGDEVLTKSFLSGNAAVMPGSSWSNQGGTSSRLIARVTQSLSSQFNRPPEEMEAALAREGLTWGAPFPPGRPLDPFWRLQGPPRLWNFEVGTNVQVTPRWGRISYATLKALWNAYDVAQICTRHLINDVRSLDYHFEADLGVRDDVSDDVTKARQFFSFPDRRLPFRAWLAKYLMDTIRYDAGFLFIRRTELGDPWALEVVNGTTMIPNIDFYGRIAADDDAETAPDLEGEVGGQLVPSYSQIIEGMPWVWLPYSDVIYQPLNPMPDSQYGLCPLEAVLLTANTDLRFQWHFLQYFTQGSIPQGFMEAPPHLSDPNQITEWQAVWDALMLGDQAKLRQIRWVPAGSKYQPVGPATDKFDSEFPLYLMRRTCAAHGITPADLGFTDTVNKATSETQVDVQFRVGTLPLVRHVEEVVTGFCTQHLGLRVRLRFDTGREIEDRLATAQAEQIYINSGVISPDEPRTRLGYPVARLRPTPRFINNTRSGPVPLLALESLAGKTDLETFGPAKDAELIDHPFVEVPGVMPVMGSADYKNAQNTTAAIQSNMIAQATGKPPPHPDDNTTSPKPFKPGAAKAAPFQAAGIAVVAQDSGRVLMQQRSAVDPQKKAAGRWEFPGGCLDGGESPWEAAKREWEEETGNLLPGKGRVVSTWENEKGPYQLFVYVVKSEEDINLNPDRDAMEVQDPDHPNARQTEVMAWWDPKDAADAGKALRKELREFDWGLIEKAAEDGASKDAFASAAPSNTGGPGVTQGVTAESGMTGSDLIDDDDEEDDDAKKAELEVTLRRWRENARNRLRKGLPPRRFTDLPPDVADEIWAGLSKATTREAIDQAFLSKAEARTDPGDDTADRFREAIRQLIAADAQRAAIRAAYTTVHPAAKTTAQPHATMTAAQRRKELAELEESARRAAQAVLLALELPLAPLQAALSLLWKTAALSALANAAQHLGKRDLPLPETGAYVELQQAAVGVADGLAHALLFQVAQEVGTAAAQGKTEAELEAVATEAILQRADLDLETEQVKSRSAVLMDAFRGQGVRKVAWVGGECARCRANRSVSPIGIDEEWPDGPPPVHPKCHCGLRPVRESSHADRS